MAGELLQATQQLKSIVEQESSRLSYSYRIIREINGVAFTCRGTGGLWINGELFGLTAGLGKCDLEKVAPTGGVLEVRDVRDLKEIKTNNHGVIKIKRQKRKSSLIRVLSEVEAFLKDLPQNEVISVGSG